jgi:hypothetical protein
MYGSADSAKQMKAHQKCPQAYEIIKRDKKIRSGVNNSILSIR